MVRNLVGFGSLAFAMIVLLDNLPGYAIAQKSSPPSDHTQEFGVPGYFTAMHKPGYANPLSSDCVTCHGADLRGGIGPSCYNCHGEAWGPDGPPGGPPEWHTVEKTGMPDSLGDSCTYCHSIHGPGPDPTSFWHAPGYRTPFSNGCAQCHGPDLDGVNGFAPSCFTCHRWTYHDFQDKAWLPADEVACFPCHDGPDWNHRLSPVTGYTVTGTTLSTVGDPVGASAKCMSCHEGSVAVDDFPGTLSSPPSEFITSSDAFGTDLTQHHPVSFTFDNTLVTAHGGLNDPSTTPSGLPSGGTIAEDLLKSGQVECTSCHDPHDNSKWAYLIENIGSLCFKCHDFTANPLKLDAPPKVHHIPGRDHPWDPFRCTMCHGVDLLGVAAAPACIRCHNDFDSLNPLGAPPPGHHGGNRFDPLSECASCHDDPNTPEELDGAPFGTVEGVPFVTPACNDCHGRLWTAANKPPLVDPGGPYSETVDREITFDASATVDPDGDSLQYAWVFGDGTSSPFPSSQSTITHAYSVVGTYTAHLSVTDGVNDPVVVSFDVEILSATAPPVIDRWDVSTTTNPPTAFQVTFDNTAGIGVDGVLTGVKNEDGATSVVFGMEMAGVIFWMDIRMNPVSSNVLWGVGDTYFGNLDRVKGTMSGVILDGMAGVSSFTGIAR